MHKCPATEEQIREEYQQKGWEVTSVWQVQLKHLGGIEFSCNLEKSICPFFLAYRLHCSPSLHVWSFDWVLTSEIWVEVLQVLPLKSLQRLFRYGRTATSLSPWMTVWSTSVADLFPHLGLLHRRHYTSFSRAEIWDVWGFSILWKSDRLFRVYERDSWWALSSINFPPFLVFLAVIVVMWLSSVQ